MAVIGIDLGTTYTAVATFIDGETEIIMVEGNPTIPSVVGVRPNGKIAIGQTAKRGQAKNPQDTIVEVKRQMGEAVQVPLGQESFAPQQISAMILKKVKEASEEELGEEIDGVVISCPAYFIDPQRHATKEAGEIAGLKVLRIVNEPTAAAYAYGLVQEGEDKERLVMVYDLGGGTFDVTVIKMIGGNLEVIGTGGDPQLGGGNFDDRIVDWMLDRLKEQNPDYSTTLTDERLPVLKRRLKAYAEEAKKGLCGPPITEEYTFQIAQVDKFEGKPIAFNATLTMEQFEELISDLMENSLKWLDEAMKVPKEKHSYTEEHLSDILLVGGSTRVPLVRKMLEKRYPNTPLRGVESGINPDEIVARGASIIAAQADPYGDEEVETNLVDVTGHTLSVAVAVQAPEEPSGFREVLHALIAKETQIPKSASHQFSSMGQMQRQCKVEVYQGEGSDPKSPDVTMIGEFFIEIDPIMEPTPIRIGLSLNEDGILVAHATNEITGQQVKCEINYDDSAQMRPDELQQKQDELEAQLAGAVGRTVNPLDDPLAATQAGGSWAQPKRPSQPSEPSPQVADPLAAMNPIMRNLYNKAISNYMDISPDRQPQVMQMVTNIEKAARANDQAMVMTFYEPLRMLLEGSA